MKSAIERFASNTSLIHESVCTLELILRKAKDLERAEQLNMDSVKSAFPFLSLIWLYSTAVRDVLHAKREDGHTLWNSPAIAALARPTMDAFLSLLYFAIEHTSAEEYEFRQLLLNRHTVYKRWDMLQRGDQSNEGISGEHVGAEADWKKANAAVLEHPQMNILAPIVRNRVASNGDYYRPEADNVLWERAGLPRDLYEVSFRYLSQYAHATPYAAASLKSHQADHEDGAVNMNIPAVLVLTCLVESLDYAGTLHPDLHALLPTAFYKFVGDH